MTPPAPLSVHCPYCLNIIAFDHTQVYEPGQHGGMIPVDLTRENEIRRTAILANASQRCIDPSDGNEHYVPVPYLINGPPLTVALVGRSGTGKSNLLGAMLAELEGGALAPFRLGFHAANQAMHSRARTEMLDRLSAGSVLGSTANAGNSVQFLDALLVKGRDGERPVGFFDVSGEDLLRADRTMRFLAGVNALIFVVDPVHALALPQLARERGRLSAGAGTTGDPTFGAVLGRLPRPGPLIDVPTSVVLAKSDLVRFDPPVDRWLSRPLRAPLDPAEVEQESRDVYAFISRHGGGAWLRPVAETRRCTLHFVSATGGSVRFGRYPLGAHSRRVAQPLLALFAMCGLLGPQLARAVGA